MDETVRAGLGGAVGSDRGIWPWTIRLRPGPARTRWSTAPGCSCATSPIRRATPKPALSVHGLAGSSTNWTDLGMMLSPWLDGVALDLPGLRPFRAGAAGATSIGGFADLVIAYLEKSGRGPVHLFGNSMGGAISLRVAALRPDLVRTLTLISPAVPDLRLRRPGSDSGMLLAAAAGPADGDPASPGRGDAGAAGAGADCTVLRRSQPGAAAPDAGGDRDPCASVNTCRGWPTLPPFAARSGRVLPGRASALAVAPAGPDHVADAGRWGDRDRLVDVSLAPRVARTVPGARLLVLSNVGHTRAVEDPVVTARAFLALREDALAHRRPGSRRRPAGPGRALLIVRTPSAERPRARPRSSAPVTSRVSAAAVPGWPGDPVDRSLLASA